MTIFRIWGKYDIPNSFVKLNFFCQKIFWELLLWVSKLFFSFFLISEDLQIFKRKQQSSLSLIHTAPPWNCTMDLSHVYCRKGEFPFCRVTAEGIVGSFYCNEFYSLPNMLHKTLVNECEIKQEKKVAINERTTWEKG